jgi:hypothetical protein
MKNFRLVIVVALSAYSAATPSPSPAQTPAPARAAPAPQPSLYAQPSSERPDQASSGAAPAGTELSLNDLGSMAFNCTKAGLNAAAREAAKERAKGNYLGDYQFSYFKLVSSSHHSIFEVHFKSNNYQDQALKYCVDVYCQQGWDPKTANPTVKRIDTAARSTRATGAERVEECSQHQTHVKQRKHR